MAVIKDEYVKNRDILIAIDPGYDATKVCINGLQLKVPNNVIDITGHASEFLTLGDKKVKGYLVSNYIADKQYLVGELARKSVREKENRIRFMNKTDMMDSYDRFETTDFEVNLMTVIGFSIVEYVKASIKNNWKPEYTIVEDEKTKVKTIPELKKARIIVGVALPNDAVNTAWPNIERILTKTHEFKIETMAGTYALGFDIPKGHSTKASQVLCALLGAASDDEGSISPSSNGAAILSNLPTVVIDGGYKTVGIFMLTQAHKASAAESNTSFAMGNVHKEVAKILREQYGRNNIEANQIPSILEEDEGMVVYKTDKGTAKLDIKKLVLEQEKEICNGLIAYLNDKFEDLLDVRQMIITGGTGAAYYKHLSSYMKEERGHLAGKVLLTDYEFNGEKIEPVYAIVIGMYKTIRHQVMLQEKAAKQAKAAAKQKS